MHRPSLSLAALGLLAGCSKPGPQQQQAAAPAGVQWAVVVLYNHPKDTAAFEKYYAETHVPLFASHAQEIGVTRAELIKFASTADGKPPTLYREADLRFDSKEALEKGTATPGFKAVAADLANTAAGEDLTSCGAVLARIIPAGSLEQIIVRVDALHALEERGIPVFNSPRAIERTVDKLWTTALLAHAGLPVPETVVCEHPDEAMAAFRALGDVIVKPLFGSMGLGMVRVSDEEMAFRVFRTLETLRSVYYLQRAIDHDGCDVRAFVVGGRVVGAIERSAPGWKTNLARGGRARAVTLPAARV